MYCLMCTYVHTYVLTYLIAYILVFLQNEKLERALNAFRSDHNELEREMVESKELAKKEQKEKEHIKKVGGLELLHTYICINVRTYVWMNHFFTLHFTSKSFCC